MGLGLLQESIPFLPIACPGFPVSYVQLSEVLLYLAFESTSGSSPFSTTHWFLVENMFRRLSFLHSLYEMCIRDSFGPMFIRTFFVLLSYRIKSREIAVQFWITLYTVQYIIQSGIGGGKRRLLHFIIGYKYRLQKKTYWRKRWHIPLFTPNRSAYNVVKF